MGLRNSNYLYIMEEIIIFFKMYKISFQHIQFLTKPLGNLFIFGFVLTIQNIFAALQNMMT